MHLIFRIVFGLTALGLFCATIYVNKLRIICPGEISRDVSSLEDGFEAKVVRLITTLEESYTLRISSGYRSPTCQDRLFNISEVAREFGLGGVTTQRGGESCHNHMSFGDPASLAVDIRPVMLSEAEQAVFYRDLQRQAEKMGLRSGASFRKKTTSPWAKYGLGWDPRHVDVGRSSCIEQLQAMRDGSSRSSIR